jgi:DoxX-like family
VRLYFVPAGRRARRGQIDRSAAVPNQLFSFAEGNTRMSIRALLIRQVSRGETRDGIQRAAVDGSGAACAYFSVCWRGIKLVLSLDAMTGPVPLPGPFLRFIGVAEVLGAIGLILPGLLRIRPGLTAMASVGLVIIMGGATMITLLTGAIAQALVPLIVGLLATFVAYGRWPLVANVGSSHRLDRARLPQSATTTLNRHTQEANISPTARERAVAIS